MTVAAQLAKNKALSSDRATAFIIHIFSKLSCKVPALCLTSVWVALTQGTKLGHVPK